MFMESPPPEIPQMVSIEDFERETERELKGPFKSKFRALFLDELDAPGPEHEWLIDDILSAGDKCIIGGPSQSGKSFLAIHAGMCVATGTPFFGRNVKQGLVIYQAGEGARGVKKRLRAWRKQNDIAFSRKVPFVLLQGAVDLSRLDGDAEPLLAEIKQIEDIFGIPALAVFLDTLACVAIGSEENSARDMGIVFSNVAKINAATGAHVCLVHHMNAGGDKLRGSTAIYANIDQTIFVKRDEATKVRTMRLGKQRDDEDSLSVQFELMSVEVGYDEARSKPITSCVCLPVGEKEAIRRSEEHRGFALRDDEREFMRVFFEVEKTLGQAVPPDMRVPATVRSIVRIADFRDELERQTPPLDIPADDASAEERAALKTKHADRIKKHVKRMGEKLKGFGVIGNGQHGDVWWMWWSGKPLRAFPRTNPQEEIPDTSPEGPGF